MRASGKISQSMSKGRAGVGAGSLGVVTGCRKSSRIQTGGAVGGTVEKVPGMSPAGQWGGHTRLLKFHGAYELRPPGLGVEGKLTSDGWHMGAARQLHESNVGSPINRTGCELTGTKSARRSWASEVK
jgi:hypothetical protein